MFWLIACSGYFLRIFPLSSKQNHRRLRLKRCLETRSPRGFHKIKEGPEHHHLFSWLPWMTYIKLKNQIYNCVLYQIQVPRSTGFKVLKKITGGASLVAQWLRVCLLMQGTWVRALVWEDPTCRGATGSVSHSYWACTSGACAPQQERPR